MKWTPDKIRAWQLETFGEPESRQLVVARALVEAAELLLEASRANPDPDKIAEEAADVAIVLAVRVDQLESKSMPPCTPAVHAREIVSFLDNEHQSLDDKRYPTAAHAQHVQRYLPRLLVWACVAVGRDLATAIDTKMERNVARTWTREGGVGKHVTPPTDIVNRAVDVLVRSELTPEEVREERARFRREGFEIVLDNLPDELAWYRHDDGEEYRRSIDWSKARAELAKKGGEP